MNIKELVYALALQETKGVGTITAKKMIAIYGSASLLFNAHQQNEIKKEINTKLFHQLFSNEAVNKAQKEIDKALSLGLKCLYYLNDDYPKYLLNCADAPLILFYDGKVNFNQYHKIISIVGTRNMTAYGRDFCAELITSVKDYNPLIVSGFAFGVDICAHLEALKHNVPTVAILAHGFGTVYPKEHKKFYAELKNSAGFLSEFTYNAQPLREHFLKRNRIVAGISQATIVIESAKKGGSLVTADIANSYHRDVFALPGKTTDVYSKGCNNLIKNHKAALITSGDDLIQQLGWEKPTIKKQIIKQPQLFVDLEGQEKEIYDLLAKKSMYADEISRSSNIPIYKVSNSIFQLEMKGLIQVLPGKLIKRN